MRWLTLTFLVAAALGLFFWQQDGDAVLDQNPSGSRTGAPTEEEERLAVHDAEGEYGAARRNALGAEPSDTAPLGEPRPALGEGLERAVSISVKLGLARSNRSEPHLTAGRHVEVELVGADGGGQWLADGTTGAEGKFDVECTLSFPAEGDAPKLRARVMELGYCEVWATLHTRDAGATYAGRVTVQTGRTLRGRVVDSKSRPIPGRVSLYRMHRDSGKVLLNLGGRAAAKGRGDFSYHAQARAFEPAGDGSQLVLLARAPGVGTGALVDFESMEPEALQAIEIVVRGPGELRGHVTDGAGEPVPGAKLKITSVHVESASSVKGRLWERITGAAPLQREIDGEGFEAIEAVTKLDGSFRFAGLRPGEYLIHTRSDLEEANIVTREKGAEGTPWLTSVRPPRIRLTPEPVTAGTPDDPVPPLALTLERRQLVVTLLRADGSPWTGPTAIADSNHRLTVHGSGGWSLHPTVQVTEQPSGTVRSSRDLGEGRFAFAIGEADSVEVLAMGGQVGGEGFAPEARTLRVKRAAGTIRLEFRAVPRVPGGTLHLAGTVVQRKSNWPASIAVWQSLETDQDPKSVFGRAIPRAEVEPIQDSLFLPSHGLDIIDVSTGRSVHSANMVVQSRDGIPLPVGRYRVSIRPLESVETFMSPESGGASAEVSIVDGEEATVRLDVDAGSTVRPYLDFGDEETSASLWLEDDRGERIDLSRPGGRFNTFYWPSRRPIQSNIVASGTYTLHVETETQHLSRSVVLKPRECLDVILR